MSKTNHKLNEKFVGANCVRPHFGEITKRENGITLIALIITIVVMLILTGVTLSVTLGDNGIVNKAKEATTQTQLEMDRELLLSAVVGAIGNDGKVNLSAMILPEGFTGSNGTYTSANGHTFTVSENGEITVAGNNIEGSTEKSILNGTYYMDMNKTGYMLFDTENSTANIYFGDEGNNEQYIIPGTILAINEVNQTITLELTEDGETGQGIMEYKYIKEDNKIVNIVFFMMSNEGKSLFAWKNTEYNGGTLTGIYNRDDNERYRLVFNSELSSIEEQYYESERWGNGSGFEPTFYIVEDNIIYCAGGREFEISDDYNTITYTRHGSSKTYTKQAN